MIAGGPIGRIPAQRLARQELAKGSYGHESPWQWLLSKLNFAAALPGGWWATAAIAVALVIIVAFVLARLGPVGRSRLRAGPALLGAGPATASEHRDLARRHAANGDYSSAIAESVRAIAADLEERTLLVPGPARTADELARAASTLFPGHAAELAAAALLFDEVCYGERTGTAEGFARVLSLDEALADARVPAVR